MSKRAIVLIATALAILAALRAASATPWPDDWDGVGFVLSIAKLDLARFAPHAPGYPVYVAMLKCAALFTRDPIVAADAVAIACGVTASIAIAWAAARALGARVAAPTALLASIAPLAWRATTAIGSESPALMLAALALFGATFEAPVGAWVVGASIGLGLGVRASWAPLFVAMIALVPRGARLRTSLVAGLATIAWVVPFVAVVGSRELAALVRTQATGHFTTWGGTAITDAGLAARASSLARDLFVDGLGAGGDELGVAIALASIALAVLGLRAWRARGWAHARLVFVVLAPYVVWIAFGQNLRAQPRHALPVVVAIAAALGASAATSRAARTVGALLFALVAARTASDALARRAIPPPGGQLVALAVASPAKPVAVFGGPSARFFDLAPHDGVVALTVGSLGDVELALGRLPSLPSRILVTSELEDVTPSADLVRVATLCRPPRIDRRAPCLDIYDWRPMH